MAIEVLWIGRPINMVCNSDPNRKVKISTVIDRWMPEHENVCQDIFNPTHVWHKVPTCTREII